jgi:hypothetical protein
MIAAKARPADPAGHPHPDQGRFRCQVYLGLFLLALLMSSFNLAGCRARANRSRNEAAGAAAATPSPRPGEVVVSKEGLANGDEAFDLKFVQERHESFILQPGAEVRISSIGGRIEVVRSNSESAEVNIVRSVDDREDIKTRQLTVKHEGNELDIHMERARRSALFSMFSDHGREKQRVLLKLPKSVNLSIEGANGRVVVTELDGNLNIDGVSGRVMIGKVSGDTSISGVHGPVRFVGDGQSNRGFQADGVFGVLELLYNGTVNAELRVDGVFGPVDQGLPNVVYEGERRQGDNSFRARVGKGGALISVSGVHGRVRIAPATSEDIASIALVKPGSTSEAGKQSPGPAK